MAKTVLRTIQECEDFIRGCTFMGTGGGGDPKLGLRILTEALEHGDEIAWIDVNDVPDDGWTAFIAGMGSIAPRSKETLKEIENKGLKEADVDFSRTLVELMDFAGIQKLDVIVPIELGGSNSANPLAYGAKLGLPCVNGDYAGRAIPEIAQTTPILAGKSLTPVTTLDRWGNICIIKEANNLAMAERIGKFISIAAYGGCMIAGFLMKGREMKEVIVPNTSTKCLELGKAVRLARECGKDPVDAILDKSNGWLLFKGDVYKKDWEDQNGYMYGTTHLKGTGVFEGHRMNIWFKNENHITWKDDAPFVTSPDIISLVEIATGEPKTNTIITKGDHLAVIGVKAPQIYRTQEGLRALGPEHFGFDIAYKPIELVVQ